MVLPLYTIQKLRSVNLQYLSPNMESCRFTAWGRYYKDHISRSLLGKVLGKVLSDRGAQYMMADLTPVIVVKFLKTH